MTGSRSRQKQLLGSIGGAFLGAVLLVAAGAKVLQPESLLAQIQLEGLDFLFPDTTVTLIALALEAGLGVALLLGVRKLWILIPTSLLVVFFLGLTGRNYWLVEQGLREPSDCGCFGSLIERTPAEAFWQDLLLLVPALLLAFWQRPSGGMPKVRLWIAAAITLGAVVWAARDPDLPFQKEAGKLQNLSEKADFKVSPNYRLISAGEEIPGSRVYESEHSAVLIITARILKAPLILDPGKRSVAELSAERLVTVDNNTLRLLEGVLSSSKTPFEVGVDGIVFSLGQSKFLLSRISP